MAAIEKPNGPDLQKLDKEHHLHPFTDHKELHAKKSRIITSADGVYIYDADGNKILDGMSGLWCVNTGYGRTELIDAAADRPGLHTVRLHTRVPVVLPERITAGLCRLLAATHLKVVVVIHANHPNELDADVDVALARLAAHGVTLLNAPGTVDADYRGEVCAILHNAGATPFVVEPGARIAQLVVAALTPVVLEESLELSASARGTGGFGSTGLR